MRRPIPLLIIAIGAALTLPGWLLAAPGQQADPAEFGIFLPLSIRGVSLDALPVPTAVAAPTDTPTEPSEPTDEPTPTEPPPTFTPVPSVTPTAEMGGAVVTGHLTTDGEPSLEGLGDGIGPGLVMRECFADGRCEIIARTAIDAEGAFSFRVPVPEPPGGFYQVQWLNEIPDAGSPFAGADLWMGAYYSPELRALDVGDEVDLGRIEIADMPLISPTNGTGFSGLPWLFTWGLREAEMGDYRWAFCEVPCQTIAERERDTFFKSRSLGRTPEYLMEQHPPGSRIGQDYKYRWYIWVDYPNGGHGESYYARMLWFFFLQGFADFGLVDPADWPGWQLEG